MPRIDRSPIHDFLRTMTITTLLTYWPQSLRKTYRRLVLQHQLRNAQRGLSYIERAERNNREAKRLLQAREALLKSDLRNI